MPVPQKYVYKAIVTRVIDGDSFICDIDLGMSVWVKDQRIRLKNVNAPALKEKFGSEMAEELRKWLEGKESTLVTFKDRKEVHGRWLGEVYQGDICVNNMINEALQTLAK